MKRLSVGSGTILVLVIAALALSAWPIQAAPIAQGNLPAGATPVRLRFAPGAVGTTISGRLDPLDSDLYVLAAQAGQTLDASVEERFGGALLYVWGPDGSELVPQAHPMAHWRVVLPAKGDYFIAVYATGAATRYTLTVTVNTPDSEQATRIQFAPGATSAVVSDHLAPGETDSYVLRALAGQTMDVTIQPMGVPPCLAIAGANGAPLKSCAQGSLEWHGRLPATQDYFIRVRAGMGQVNYILTVAISALRPTPTPQPVRIWFAPGATSGAVSGRLGAGESARYVLRALRGQSMALHLTSTGALSKQVFGPGGSSWEWPFVEGSPRIPSLPTTGDYVIVLTAVEPGVKVRYTMDVVIPPR